MKQRTLILLIIAVGCGLFASYLTSKLLADRAQPQEQEVEMATYVIAKEKIRAETHITDPDKLFKLKEVPKGTEPKNTVATLEELKDKRIRHSIKADSHITKEDLLDKNEGLRGRIKEGMRAVAIHVTAERTSGGFVLAEDRVDVIWTSRGGDLIALTLFENMRVLATDTLASRPEDGITHVPTTITLEVDPDQAELIRLGQTVGELSLSLRPYDDKVESRPTGKKAEDIARALTNKKRENEPTEKPAPLPAPVQPGVTPQETKPEKKFVQTIYNGTERSVTHYTEPSEVSPIKKSKPELDTKDTP